MNEVNVVASLDSVIGLFINKCSRQQYILSQALIIQKFLNHMFNIEYPIYLYDSKYGNIDRIELTVDLQDEIISNLQTKNIFYWPDDYNEPVFAIFDNVKSKSL